MGLNQRFRREFIALEDKKVHSINAVWEQANKEKVCFENFNNIKYDLGVHLIDLAIQLGLLTKDTKELIKYESYTNNDQSYTLLFKDRVSIRTRSTIFKGENLLHIRFLDEGGIALSEIKESGDVTTWKDSYTFTDMISSFINSNSKSNITEDILLLTKILCW